MRLIIIGLHVILFLIGNEAQVPQLILDKTSVSRRKELRDFSFQKIPNWTVDRCFLSCAENCRCMTFQLCNKTECHLLSSNKHLNSSALVQSDKCDYYDVKTEASPVNGVGHCTPQITCCHISNPCENGGTCEALSTGKARFTCKCSPGFTGELCELPIRSCVGHSNGSRLPGKYVILDRVMKPFEVFCDFDAVAAWTLIQSYELQNNAAFQDIFEIDHPVNGDDPNWSSYRLSKPRMLSLQQHSMRWRWTCKYDTDGVVFKDYVQVENDKVDIFSTYPGECREVAFIDIRGKRCNDIPCTARFYQGTNPLHIDASYMGCDFHLTDAIDSEDSFGLYTKQNKAHRCTSSAHATTQTWFGNLMQ